LSLIEAIKRDMMTIYIEIKQYLGDLNMHLGPGDQKALYKKLLEEFFKLSPGS